ncbi:unnamed protein product [Phytomonas sp. EM1]|nr:unnamed protein product [Phytomonas sp. EM1]|eukprot:CCW64982.1 unnamed protein product [Phytomonas sp. isolate EM1]
MAGVQRRIRADGRFDTPLRSAAFGIVLFRWLLQDDDATRRLAEAWQGVLTERLRKTPQEEGEKELVGAEANPPRVQLSLVVLQKRVWIRISLLELSVRVEEDGAGEDSDESVRRAEAYVMSTLQAAAERMDDEGFCNSSAAERGVGVGGTSDR